MLFAAMVDYKSISRYYVILYVLNVLLLTSVFFIGSAGGGATRWIKFGGVGIQPSEFSKVIMIFCMAKFIDKKSDKINNVFVLLAIVAVMAVPFVLTLKQPSLSASLVLIAILFAEIFAGGIKTEWVLKVLGIAIPLFLFIVWDVQRADPLITDKIFTEYQMGRILSWVHPDMYSDTYYQTMKSMSAIGSGQLMGKGLYQGTLNQLSYLPEPHNDFIFSVIGEEFGFLGCMLVLGLLLFIMFRCVLIAMQTRDNFSRLMVAGVVGMIGFQTFVNVGVATGMLPNTGMSLPFVSYGGSSMWTNMIAVGLVLNVGLKRSKTLFEGGFI